jgi:hypothetical protein
VNVLSVKKEVKPQLNRKIVFCRPRGGLNDMFVQMQKCYEYAMTYNRELYVDGSRGGFLDNFNNYFTAPNGIFFEGFDFMRYEFTCYPECLKNDIINYQLVWSGEKRCYVITADEPITFDFTKSYEEDILVHELGGGGFGVKALEWLRLNEKVRIHIVNILEKLDEYDAIHVRNADYKTDYKAFFENIKDKLGNKVVLCTDDLQCRLYAKSFFGNKLYIVTELPDTQEKNLHGNRNLDRYSTNLNTLADLFVLANGKNLFFTTIHKGWFSGFSRLANSLHERQDWVKKILHEKER